MSNFRAPREEDASSQSSDEKMDTGSESFRSQDTPNSVLSSDFEIESNVLRLQNPDNSESLILEEPSTENSEPVLRLSEPIPETELNDNVKPKSISRLKEELSDSLVTNMSKLNLKPGEIRPKNLGVSPPKLSTALVLTTNHPLMNLNSPDYPDLIPKRPKEQNNRKEDDKDLSLSSVEDERHSEMNGYDFYTPHLNTSKNNLYFSENFTDNQIERVKDVPPDVARVRRRIIPKNLDKSIDSTPPVEERQSAIRLFEQKVKECNHSTPITNYERESDFSEVSAWRVSPAHARSVPSFDLPIEMSATVANNHELGSPDVLSSSTQGDKSTYQALLDPYTGSVALRHHGSHTSPTNVRRKIQLPAEDEDRSSLDSISVSMDEEEPEQEPDALDPQITDDEDTKRSKSTNTGSSCSEPIPEYSAAEELRDERSWLTVRTGGADATCDMKVIEPYKRVLSHGGYDALGSAIIVFSACHLPDNSRPDYRYVMDNLFLYVIWTLERLVTDDYVLVYLHGSAGGRRLPTFRWLQECYKLIDRRLRKSLKHLYLVHPTFWLKSFVILTKPFVSSKFFRKLSYVTTLEDLMRQVPVEPNAIPDIVKQFDSTRR